jgi:hypothetical protein
MFKLQLPLLAPIVKLPLNLKAKISAPVSRQLLLAITLMEFGVGDFQLASIALIRKPKLLFMSQILPTCLVLVIAYLIGCKVN